MTTTAPVSVSTTERPADSGLRLVAVPTGRVSLVDRVRLQLGLALLLASTKHAARPESQRAPRRIDLDRRPLTDARPFS
ncbi:MAG TPA: hypothetical protein VGC94_03730 [Amnibacterium sp.]|jgi:hypothetical protein